MTGKISGDFIVKNSKFKQIFQAQSGASLFTLLAQADNKQEINIDIQNSQFQATVSSNTVSNYGFIKEETGKVQKSFNNISGYVSGAYYSLTQDLQADQIFERQQIKVELNKDQDVLLDQTVDFNNTMISFGTYGNNITATGKIALYHGIYINQSSLSIQCDQFSILAPQLTKTVAITNVLLNISINATVNKLAGIAIQTNKQQTLTNCTFMGTLNSTGSVYLLFEQTSQLIVIDNLTTNCQLIFGEDSYGLIKSVIGGIQINGINSNLTMNIIGDQIVDSCLMFNQVSTRGTINNVVGYYGGYVNNFTCSSQNCQLNVTDENIQLQTRELKNVGLSVATQNVTYLGDQYKVFQPQPQYFGMLNGTKVQFLKQNMLYSVYNNTSFIFNILGDSQRVINTEVRQIISTDNQKMVYFGGIAGISTKQNYVVKNVYMNIEFTATNNAGGNSSSFFGFLNTSITFTNVTLAGNIQSNTVVGGIVGYLQQASVIMENVSIQGSYISGALECGGVIGIISEQSSTSLINATISNVKISSISEGSGPIYGINNGTIQQFQINSMTLDEASYYNDCPIGLGTKQQYSQCPQKPNISAITITGFPLITTIASTGLHGSVTIHHVFDNARDINDTTLSISIADMVGQQENRSIFGEKVSYNNMQLIVENVGQIKWGKDIFAFAFIQVLISDTTTNINNIFIQSPMNGSNYAYAGTVAQIFSSNASVSNVTTNISLMYFYHTSAFVQQVIAKNPIFTNINVNASSCQGANQVGFFEFVNKSMTLQIINGTVQAQANRSVFKGGIASQIYDNCGDIIITNLTVNTLGQTNGSVTYACYVINTFNAENLLIDNSTFNMTTNITGTGSGLFQKVTSSGSLNFTNSNFTGTLDCVSNYAYDIGTLEGQIQYGNRNVTNCTVYKQKLIGTRSIGGLFGYVNVNKSVGIHNTTVDIAIQFNYSSTIRYGGAFVGYKANAASELIVTNSSFKNANMAENISCDSMLNGSNYTQISDVTCQASQKQVVISEQPTFSRYYYNASYESTQAACYWENLDDTQDWNQTTFEVQESAYNQNCGNSGHALYTLFNPGFVPSQIKDITITGTLKSIAYYRLQLTLLEKNSQTQNTTYQNINVQVQFLQEPKTSSQHFNTTGIVAHIQGQQKVSFINCVSAYTITRTTTQMSYQTSSSSGFYYNNTLYSAVQLENCVSNMTLTQNDFYDQTQLYSIGYILGNCHSTGFTTNGEAQQC